MTETVRPVHATIIEATIGSFVTLRKVIPAGVLQSRRLRSGAISLYWRYTFAGKTERVVIGFYDSTRPPRSLEPDQGRYSIAAAEYAAQAMAKAHTANRHDGGYREIAARTQHAAERLAADKLAASKQSLKRLLFAYCDHLESLGRVSHRDARSIFTLHVAEAWPENAALPASEVSSEDVADMLRRLFESGKGRTANKLRAYMRSAYEIARRARSDPKVPIAFKAFGIRSNPAAETAANASENRSAKHPLHTADMQTYWSIIKGLAGIEGAALRLHLLTGGQRVEQLVRLRTANIASGSIMLHDGKGRPGKPARLHTVPLIREAERALIALRPTGEFALSTDGGKTHLAATTLSRWAAGATGTSIPEFQTKRLRSGVETLLAAAGVSKDIRGRLQSHGIGGIQDAHYDAHDYLPEKRDALNVLWRVLVAKHKNSPPPVQATAVSIRPHSAPPVVAKPVRKTSSR